MSKFKSKILIVEDDMQSQQYYSFVFKDRYDPYIVSTVSAAKKALRETNFNLAIIDISLPGNEDGFSLLKYIHEQLAHKIPAIAITAHAFPQNRTDALAAGADEFFTKPILGSVLLKVVQRYVEDM